MTVMGTLRWVSMLTLISLVGGNFTGQAFAEGPGRFHVGGSSFTGQDLVAARHFQFITSTIGDFDCFGYPDNIGTGPSTAPCGTLPDLPIQDVNDDPQTDIDLACPGAWQGAGQRIQGKDDGNEEGGGAKKEKAFGGRKISFHFWGLR